MKSDFRSAHPLPQFFLVSLGLLSSIAVIACDQPPDPNMPPVIDDTYNITELANFIAASPNAVEEAQVYRMKGSWESFSASGDPLGKLYAAIAPLGQFTMKKIALDFSPVTGGNIADSPAGVVRSYKAVLRAVTFPEGIQTIGAYSFNGCANLNEITFSGGAPPAIAGTAFTGIANPVTIHIPAGTTTAYNTIRALFSGALFLEE
jgi:hypothetical protein